MAYGPLNADIRGIDPGQILPLGRVEYPQLILDDGLSHPRLMEFSRIEGYRYREPWQGYYQLVMEEADRWIRGGIDNAGMLEKNRAASAKALAAAYRITGDRRYLDAVEDAFSAVSPLPEVVSFQGGTAGVGWGDDLEMGEALRHYAAAFDLTMDNLDPTLREHTIVRFAEACDRLVERMPLIPPDNHAFIISSGVASMALVLAGYQGITRRSPQEWMDAAMSLQSYAIAAQVLPDGTYREGPHYARYSIAALLPYYLYVQRLYHRNLARHPRLNAWFNWMVLTSNPDGSVPQTDDGWSEINLWEPLLVPLARNPETIVWSYQRREHQFVRYQPNMVDALAFASFWRESDPPDGPPSRIFPDGGMAVFKDGWEETAFQVSLLGEPATTFGGRHEQADPGNLLIQKGSKPLLVDAGYAPGGTGDPNYEGYRDAGSHNMILLNNRGPEKNPLWVGDPGGSMGGAFDGPILGGCRVDMRYGQQPVVRRILVPGHSYVVLEDLAPGNSEATMASLFHAPGDVSPGEHGGYRWFNGDASLSLIPVSPPSVLNRMTLSRSYHSHQPNRSELHQRIDMEWGNPQGSLALLIPDERIQVTPLAVSGSLASAGWIIEGSCDNYYGRGYFGNTMTSGGFRDLVLVGDGSEIRGGGIITDAFRTWVRIDDSGDLTGISLREAGFFEYDGLSLELSRRTTATFWRSGLQWSGYSECGIDSVEMRFRGIGDPGIVRFRGHIIPYRYESGVIVFTIIGEGPFEFGGGPPGIWVPEPRLEESSFLQEMAWRPDPEMRFRLMSPRDQARMEGEIIAGIREGVTGSLDPLMRDRLGVEGGGEAAVEYMLGMADAMTSSKDEVEIRIPHRTRFHRQVGDMEMAVEGEGFWGDENLRRFGGSIATQDGRFLEYEEERPFQEITRREFNVGMRGIFQSGIRHEDSPGGDLWGTNLWKSDDGHSYQTGFQWGTGDMEDFRWGELGVNSREWGMTLVGGRNTGSQSMLADFQHILDGVNLGYRYQYMSRGVYRGMIRASDRWQHGFTGGSWEWTGGDVPSVHIIRNQTGWWDSPWSMLADIVTQVPDSIDIILSGGYVQRVISVHSSIRGNSESQTVIPDRLMRITVDPVEWSTVTAVGRVVDETERTAETIVSCHPNSKISFHGYSGWDRECVGPVRVGGGWLWCSPLVVGSDVWRQWYPIREDGMYVSMATGGLPPINPFGSFEVRWSGGGEVREVRLRIESRCADIGPGILYLDEPGVDRRLEGYFRISL